MASALPGEFVKVCGVTTVEDARVVVEAGASALGLIFAESPRRVTVARAREIAAATDGTILRCAVFWHDDDAYVIEHLDAVDVDVVQLHGALSAELLGYLRGRDVHVVKALSIEGPEFDDFDDAHVEAVLLDGTSPGSGVRHEWGRLKERHFAVPVVAAGGLTPANVSEVVRATGVWGVDCASGVEASPGVKDPELVRRFVANALTALRVERDVIGPDT